MRYDVVDTAGLGNVDAPPSGSIVLRRATAAPRIAGLASATFASLLLTPYFAIGWAAAQDGELISTVASYAPSDVASAMLLGAAATLALAILCWSIAHTLSCRRLHREVTILPGQVEVRDTIGGATRAWREPLTSYRGLAHRVRTSLSGSRHELWLIHRDATKSFPLKIATMMGETEIAARAQQMGLDVVPFGQHARQKPAGRPSAPNRMFKADASTLAAQA